MAAGEGTRPRGCGRAELVIYLSFDLEEAPGWAQLEPELPFFPPKEIVFLISARGSAGAASSALFLSFFPLVYFDFLSFFPPLCPRCCCERPSRVVFPDKSRALRRKIPGSGFVLQGKIPIFREFGQKGAPLPNPAPLPCVLGGMSGKAKGIWGVWGGRKGDGEGGG